MDTMRKLSILGEAARYDVSCSSSGIPGRNPTGICHTWTSDGRCISLLKVLLSNVCVYNCAYCPNRRENDIPRATFTPRELSFLTFEFYRRNYIEGLFLSSGVVKNPDHTMDLLIETIRILKNDFGFGGYIHVKTIPGASDAAVERLGAIADRVSVNLEFCDNHSLSVLAPEKSMQQIFRPMKLIQEKRQEAEDDRKNRLHPPSFVPAGQSTQLIVGAVNESDAAILSLSQHLYQDLQLKRVYYSAYIPMNTHPDLPAVSMAPPLLREHRLYQADWLLRFYRFNASELVSRNVPDLDMRIDPKCSWAIRNFSEFPIEINRADYEMLLRVPGIGMLSAKKILAARKYRALSYEDALKLGIVMKRAVFFLTFSGKYKADVAIRAQDLYYALADRRGRQWICQTANPLQISMEEL